METLLRKCHERAAETEAAVLAGHLELLMDEELEKDVCGSHSSRRLLAEQAVETVIDEIVREFYVESESPKQIGQDFKVRWSNTVVCEAIE